MALQHHSWVIRRLIRAAFSPESQAFLQASISLWDMPRSLAAPSRSVILASIEAASEVVVEICVATSVPPNWVAVRETALRNLFNPLFSLAVCFADSTFFCRQASCRAFSSAWACCGDTRVVAAAVDGPFFLDSVALITPASCGVIFPLRRDCAQTESVRPQ